MTENYLLSGGRSGFRIADKAVQLKRCSIREAEPAPIHCAPTPPGRTCNGQTGALLRWARRAIGLQIASHKVTGFVGWKARELTQDDRVTGYVGWKARGLTQDDRGTSQGMSVGR